jgi:hypothetical protein
MQWPASVDRFDEFNRERVARGIQNITEILCKRGKLSAAISGRRVRTGEAAFESSALKASICQEISGPE